MDSVSPTPPGHSGPSLPSRTALDAPGPSNTCLSRSHLASRNSAGLQRGGGSWSSCVCQPPGGACPHQGLQAASHTTAAPSHSEERGGLLDQRPRGVLCKLGLQSTWKPGGWPPSASVLPRSLSDPELCTPCCRPGGGPGFREALGCAECTLRGSWTGTTCQASPLPSPRTEPSASRPPPKVKAACRCPPRLPEGP